MPKMFRRFVASLSNGEKFTSSLNLLLAASVIVLAVINISQLLAGKATWLSSEMLQSAILLVLGIVIAYFLANDFYRFRRNYLESHRMTKLGEVIKKMPLEDFFEKAQKVDILTASNLRFFGDAGAHLLAIAKRRNIKCRFISLNPNSPASDEFLDNKSPNIQNSDNKQDRLVIPCIDIQYKNLTEWFTQNVEYYLTNANIPFSIMAFSDERGNTFFLKVDFYAIEIGSADRPCIYFDQTDNQQIAFFNSQFELIRENKSEPYFINGKFNETLWRSLHKGETESPTAHIPEKTGDKEEISAAAARS